MKRAYNVAKTDNPVSIKVQVGTVGVAYTAVYNARTGGQRKKLANSTIATTGSIRKQAIGTGLELEGSYLVIPTLIDFAGIPDSELERASQTIFIRYILEGGISGKQEFNYDIDDVTASSSGKIISINKPIQLK